MIVPVPPAALAIQDVEPNETEPVAPASVGWIRYVAGPEPLNASPIAVPAVFAPPMEATTDRAHDEVPFSLASGLHSRDIGGAVGRVAGARLET